MAKKVSIKKAAKQFAIQVDGILAFTKKAEKLHSDEHVSWCYNYAVIQLYSEFESLVLTTLIGAINNDTSTISASAGIDFPKHLTDEVCGYLIVGTGFFDFRGRDGLIKKLKHFIPEDHYLVEVVKKSKYKNSLEQLSALRNFAAHCYSISAKRSALAAVSLERIGSSGTWLKRQGRFESIVAGLANLADEIGAKAPF